MATIKCDRCGIESEIEQASAREHSGPRGRGRHFCPACQRARLTASWKRMYQWAAVLGLLGLLSVVTNPGEALGWLFLGLPLCGTLMIPLTILHEMAHALAARLFHLRVFAVALGFGSVVWTRRLLGIEWQVRALPIGGQTVLGGPEASGYRLRMFLAVLAGPAVHVLTFIAVAAWWVSLPQTSPLHPLGWTLLTLNVALLVANLWPRRVATGYGLIDSDGRRLLRLPFLPATELVEQHVAYYVMEALDAGRRGDAAAARRWCERGLERYPESPEAGNGLGVILLQQGEFALAREIFAALRTRADIKRELRCLVLNNIAYADLLLGDAGLLAEADECSREAYGCAPWLPACMGTRGAVLVELGRVDEGIGLLKDAMASHIEKESKAAEAVHLAIAEQRRGDIAASERYLDLARALDPNCFLLKHIDPALGESPVARLFPGRQSAAAR